MASQVHDVRLSAAASQEYQQPGQDFRPRNPEAEYALISSTYPQTTLLVSNRPLLIIEDAQ